MPADTPRDALARVLYARYRRLRHNGADYDALDLRERLWWQHEADTIRRAVADLGGDR